MSDADRAEWAAFAKGIRLLPGRALPAEPAGASTIEAPQPQPAAGLHPAGAAPGRPPRGPVASLLAVGQEPGGLDRSSWNRLQRGKLTPERKLDLHGRTAQAAFHALEAFLRAAHADHVRCVEIVTGRGTGETGGVIRRELPHWLNLPSLRPLVLAATHPHPANTGAVRLLLRRLR